jgi:hypothetical protein
LRVINKTSVAARKASPAILKTGGKMLMPFFFTPPP